MRLTAFEQQAFIDVLKPYIKEPAELRLFGSRIHDEAKGGDIDLMVIVTFDKTASKLMYHKAKILSEMKTIVGEQKIDLLMTTFHNPDIFIQTILPDSLLLYRY